MPAQRHYKNRSAEFPVRGELTVALAGYLEIEGVCDAQWYHAGVSVAYRPFAEPDPPAQPSGRARRRGVTL